MAFTVQNDQGSVAGANAYETAIEFRAYFVDRGTDISDYTDGEIENAIVQATDYIDQRFKYVGRKRGGRQQTTEWPRTDAYDSDRYYINDVPFEIKEACFEYARRALINQLSPDPVRDDTGQAVLSKTEKVGPISESVTFSEGAVFKLPRYPAADEKLKRAGLVRTGGQVSRG